jgi:alanine-synthesizing transaminase
MPRQRAVRHPDGREGRRRGLAGVGFGEHGEGYVRIALVENEQRIRQAARGVRRFLESGIETLHNVVPLANRR